MAKTAWQKFQKHPWKSTGKAIASGWEGTVDRAAAAGRWTKGAALNSAILAGILGIGTYLAITPRGREFREEDTAVAQLPPLLTPQDLMLQPTPQEMSGPADGRAPGEWQARVRGNDQQRAATQPSLDSGLASGVTQIS